MLCEGPAARHRGPMNAFDYVIVGRRNGRLRARQPALGETAGIPCCCSRPGPAIRYPWIHVPIGYAKTMFHPVYNWCFSTEPDPGMNGRQIYWPRGRTLGRLERDQRAHLHPRAAQRTTIIGPRWQSRLEPCGRAPMVSQARAQRPRRQRLARRRRPAMGLRHRGRQHELVEALIAAGARSASRATTTSTARRRKVSAITS